MVINVLSREARRPKNRNRPTTATADPSPSEITAPVVCGTNGRTHSLVRYRDSQTASSTASRAEGGQGWPVRGCRTSAQSPRAYTSLCPCDCRYPFTATRTMGYILIPEVTTCYGPH